MDEEKLNKELKRLQFSYFNLLDKPGVESSGYSQYPWKITGNAAAEMILRDWYLDLQKIGFDWHTLKKEFQPTRAWLIAHDLPLD